MNPLTRILVCCSALLPLEAVAQDASRGPQHLEPVEGIFYQFGDDYHQRVREILIGDIADATLARMLTIPSIVPECVVSLIKTKNGYSVVRKTVSKPIWPDRTKKEVRVIENSRPLDEATSWLIFDAFLKATSGARYSKEDLFGLDGATYYFSAAQYKTGRGFPREGKTWSPKSESVCGQLVALGQLLEEYALG